MNGFNLKNDFRVTGCNVKCQKKWRCSLQKISEETQWWKYKICHLRKCRAQSNLYKKWVATSFTRCPCLRPCHYFQKSSFSCRQASRGSTTLLHNNDWIHRTNIFHKSPNVFPKADFFFWQSQQIVTWSSIDRRLNCFRGVDSIRSSLVHRRSQILLQGIIVGS